MVCRPESIRDVAALSIARYELLDTNWLIGSDNPHLVSVARTIDKYVWPIGVMVVIVIL